MACGGARLRSLALKIYAVGARVARRCRLCECVAASGHAAAPRRDTQHKTRHESRARRTRRGVTRGHGSQSTHGAYEFTTACVPWWRQLYGVVLEYEYIFRRAARPGPRPARPRAENLLTARQKQARSTKSKTQEKTPGGVRVKSCRFSFVSRHFYRGRSRPPPRAKSHRTRTCKCRPVSDPPTPRGMDCCARLVLRLWSHRKHRSGGGGIFSCRPGAS